MSAAKKISEADISLQKELVVSNKLGIHARPAALFVKTANRYECEISVEKDGEKVNGKSIMGLMMLAAEEGSKVKIVANGEDEKDVLTALEQLFDSRFNEKE